jgi:protocatechuate 3,4-dioxygenase beta subunit
VPNGSQPPHPRGAFPETMSAAITPNRRDVLRVGAAALGLGAIRLRMPATAGAQDAASPTADICLLTPEQTEGPYYLPLELVRADISEDKPGIPLQLRIAVADVNACTMLEDAAVDIWHCDAQGFYSGVTGEPGAGASQEAGAGAEAGTFLRGIQLTNADGVAEFQTIYPGWYSGRTVHIHMKVHVGGTADVLDLPTPAAETGTYEGGHVSHTGQLYFDDAISDEVYAGAEAYAGRDDAQRLRNDQDGILGDHADEPGFIMTLTPLVEGSITDGFLGEITIGVDPAATPEPAGFGGGGPGEGGPPPGGGQGSPPPDGPAPDGGASPEATTGNS